MRTPSLVAIFLLTSQIAYGIPNDFDGDGRSDPAGITVQTDGSSNEILIARRLTSTGETIKSEFGSSSETSVHADYDGDGLIDLAVVGPDSEHKLLWRVKSSMTEEITSSSLGESGDFVLGGCLFDNDNKAEKTVINSSGIIKFEKSSDAAVQEINSGVTDIELATCGDTNGDLIDEVVGLKKITTTKNKTHSMIYVWNISSGEVLNSFTIKKNIKDIFLADIDGDGIKEIGFQPSGAKTKELIFYKDNPLTTYTFPVFLRASVGKFDATEGQTYGVLLKIDQNDTFILYPSFSDLSIFEYVTLEDTSTILVSNIAATSGTPSLEKEGCSTTHEAPDGPNGFLWKPVSDSTKNVAVHVPSEMNFKKAMIVKNQVILEKLYYGNRGNGNRQLWRSRQRYSSFPTSVVFKGIARDNTTDCWFVSDTSERID